MSESENKIKHNKFPNLAGIVHRCRNRIDARQVSLVDPIPKGKCV